MILLDKLKYKKIIDDLKLFNRRKDKSDWHKGFGLNFKYTDLQASLGISQFERLNNFIKIKKNIAKIYLNNIKNTNIEVYDFKDSEVPWFFDIKVKTNKYKRITIENLKSNNIEIRESYPALSKQNYLKNVEKTDLSNSEKISDKIIWLPSSTNLTNEDVYYICETINKIKE